MEIKTIKVIEENDSWTSFSNKGGLTKEFIIKRLKEYNEVNPSNYVNETRAEYATKLTHSVFLGVPYEHIRLNIISRYYE